MPTVATTLIDEYNLRRTVELEQKDRKRGRNRRKGKKKSDAKDRSAARAETKSDSESLSDAEKTARALAAALKGVHTSEKDENGYDRCGCCGKKSHVEDACYLNPDNPDNRLPAKVLDQIKGRRSKGNSEESTNGRKVEIVCAIVEKVFIAPRKDRRTYADRGAKVHCFHNKSVFVPESLKNDNACRCYVCCR